MLSTTSNTTPLVRAAQSQLSSSRLLCATGVSISRLYHSQRGPLVWTPRCRSCAFSRGCGRCTCNPQALGRDGVTKRGLSGDKQRSPLNFIWKTASSAEMFCMQNKTPWGKLFQSEEQSVNSKDTDASSKDPSPNSLNTNYDFVIDPITNKKVPLQSSNGSNSMYRQSQEHANAFGAEFLHAGPRLDPESKPPTSDELDKYRKVDIGIPSYNEELIHRVNDLPKERPQGVPQEPITPSSKAPEPPVEIKDELERYRNVDVNYPPSMNEELIHRVRDLPEKPDPDAASQNPATNSNTSVHGEPMYEDLDKYKPYMPSQEAMDPSSEEVQPRSWPSRVRHLSRNIGGSQPNKAVETRAERLGGAAPRGMDPKLGNAARLQRSFQAHAPRSAQAVGPIMETDLYSKEPMGLEKSWARECLVDPQADRMYIRHYSSDRTASEPVYMRPGSQLNVSETNTSTEAQQETSSVQQPEAGSEPILYKILAYDPTMQTINMAETTSAVPDASTPLSPAEVMLRLSNPTKFFPHLKSLQEEGFEIASGSGDVLVFRKVRSPSTATKSTSSVNPIDMMGKRVVPEIGNFASPTGYLGRTMKAKRPMSPR